MDGRGRGVDHGLYIRTLEDVGDGGAMERILAEKLEDQFDEARVSSSVFPWNRNPEEEN